MPPSPTDFVLRAAVDGDGAQLAGLIRGVFAEYENCPFVPDEFVSALFEDGETE